MKVPVFVTIIIIIVEQTKIRANNNYCSNCSSDKSNHYLIMITAAATVAVPAYAFIPIDNE